jgi:predicted nucleic acid-binding protein
MNVFVLDACALIAYFAREKGAENIKAILKEAIDTTNTKIYMNKINLLEVYYDVIKNYSEQEADKMLETLKEMPIELVKILEDAVLKKAGYLKSKYKLSIADAIAAAESIVNKGSLVTADHHEIGPLEITENMNVTWFR